MANKSLFKSLFGKLVRPADAVNEAGGPAYAFTPRHALAQYAATGCLNATFYASAEEQLATVLALCKEIDAGAECRQDYINCYLMSWQLSSASVSLDARRLHE